MAEFIFCRTFSSGLAGSCGDPLAGSPFSEKQVCKRQIGVFMK